MKQRLSSVQQSSANSTATKTSSPTSSHRPVVSRCRLLEQNKDCQLSKMINVMSALRLHFSDSFLYLFVFQFPSSQSPEISVLITSECARFWLVALVIKYLKPLCVCSLMLSQGLCLFVCFFRVVGWRHPQCYMAWCLRRRRREMSHQWKTPRSLCTPAPLTAWWQRPR